MVKRFEWKRFLEKLLFPIVVVALLAKFGCGCRSGVFKNA